MHVTRREYKAIVGRHLPASPVARDCAAAFLAGGAICAAGQAITGAVTAAGWGIKDARLLCTVALIAASVLLTALHLYDKIARHAGAGTLVPITGFANAVAAPAIEFKSEGLVSGLGAKMFVIAGPVLVYGFAAATLYGAILWIASLF